MYRCEKCNREVLRLNRTFRINKGEFICASCKRKLKEIEIKNLKNVG